MNNHQDIPLVPEHCPWVGLAEALAAGAELALSPAGGDPGGVARNAIRELAASLALQGADACPIVAALASRLDALARSLPATRPAAPAPAPAACIRGPGRALLAMDYMTSLEMMNNLLAARGFIVQQATSSVRALVAIDAYRPDLVLLDTTLPAVGGRSLLAHMVARLPDACLIAVGAPGAATPRGASAHKIAGALTLDELPDTLDQILEDNGLWHRLALRRSAPYAARARVARAEA